jgi:hypothetical protein
MTSCRLVNAGCFICRNNLRNHYSYISWCYFLTSWPNSNYWLLFEYILSIKMKICFTFFRVARWSYVIARIAHNSWNRDIRQHYNKDAYYLVTIELQDSIIANETKTTRNLVLLYLSGEPSLTCTCRHVNNDRFHNRIIT